MPTTRQSSKATFQTLVGRERDLQEDFLAAIRQDRPESIDIISAGLSSRYQTVVDLLELSLAVRILVQSRSIAIDRIDVGRMPTIINTLLRSLATTAQANLEIRGSTCVVTLRAMLARHSGNEYKRGILSWYTYDATQRVMGHNNPALLLESTTEGGVALLRFAAAIFARDWRASQENVLYPKRRPTP